MFYPGPFLGFSGSVVTNKIHMDILVPILPLCWHPHDISMRTMAARCFGAFKKAVEKLENYYKNELPAIEERSMQPEQPFPYKCDYQSLENNATVRFKYKDQPIPKKLLFLADTDKGSKKCIKFTRRYSKDAHLSCASQGYAPSLRGFEALPGEWYMVVMDLVDIDVYKPYSIRNMTSSSANFPSVAQLRPKVEEIIKHLHRNGLVHGDVRDSNLLVRTDDEVGCMLVDFDWAGKEGEVHYPINVNRIGITRPDEARDGLPIKKEHDLEMIKIMFDSRSLSFMDQD
jgi:serine/threonine protein kinase